MSCLPSMPKHAWRIWTTPRATSCAAKKLPRYSRRSKPRLPLHVQRHCPPAPWPRPRTTHWRFGRNSRASWNTRNLSSATTSPKTPCALWRSVAKTGSTSAVSRPDPKSPPSSLLSKPADGCTSPCANTWPLSSPVSPIRRCTALPSSPLPPGPRTGSNLHSRCQPCVCSDAYGQLTLHADRGTSMRSKPVALLLADLGVTKTHSRPHVSDDNPYSESQFRTLKYRPEFPDRFGCLQDSRAFCQSFFRWYNEEHRHSGIGLLTPATVHYGQAENILRQRQDVLDVAYQRHPERFVRSAPKPPVLPSAVWINKPVPTPEPLPVGSGR